MVTVKRTRILRWLQKNHNIRKPFLIGGADSGKSYAIQQYLILDKFFGETKKDILILRKTRVDCKGSCYKEMLEMLEEYGLPYNVNKSDLIITSADNRKNTIMFAGLDDRHKYKSKAFNYVWFEELTQFLLDDYLELARRCRRKTDTVNQIIGSLNPIDAHSWIKEEIVDKPKDNMVFDLSSVDDNPFADEADIQELDELKDVDINQYNVYRWGKWGVLKNIIYSGWKAYNHIDEYGPGLLDVSYGIDWGYAKPCSLIKVYWFDGDKVIWEEIIHQKGLTIPQFIQRAKERIPDPNEWRKEFYAGTDQPGAIQQFYDAGFNIDGAVTHVVDGINYCQAHLVGIIGANLIKEAQGYKRKEDKDGHVMEEPVKFMDHGMDAGRYGTYSRAVPIETEEYATYEERVNISPV